MNARRCSSSTQSNTMQYRRHRNASASSSSSSSASSSTSGASSSRKTPQRYVRCKAHSRQAGRQAGRRTPLWGRIFFRPWLSGTSCTACPLPSSSPPPSRLQGAEHARKYVAGGPLYAHARSKAPACLHRECRGPQQWARQQGHRQWRRVWPDGGAARTARLPADAPFLLQVTTGGRKQGPHLPSRCKSPPPPPPFSEPYRGCGPQASGRRPPSSGAAQGAPRGLQWGGVGGGAAVTTLVVAWLRCRPTRKWWAHRGGPRTAGSRCAAGPRWCFWAAAGSSSRQYSGVLRCHLLCTA